MELQQSEVHVVWTTHAQVLAMRLPQIRLGTMLVVVGAVALIFATERLLFRVAGYALSDSESSYFNPFVAWVVLGVGHGLLLLVILVRVACRRLQRRRDDDQREGVAPADSLPDHPLHSVHARSRTLRKLLVGVGLLYLVLAVPMELSARSRRLAQRLWLFDFERLNVDFYYLTGAERIEAEHWSEQMAVWTKGMRRKYYFAASYPFLPVLPDELEPEMPKSVREALFWSIYGGANRPPLEVNRDDASPRTGDGGVANP
jgi:hypothetical protein